ncbi:MAG: sulfurtransferase TusA family protein [Pseudomonadota bacterium]|uniref:sulfurtransferase TusA family protein n=1 Tax=Thermithiobacillus tepidarius TaxID=929 RepID=UPI000428E8F4|nr:sulfurtransferase TusA family protein [Thermithiobacillus tepidarius]
MDTETLDVRGKSCPTPVLETRKALKAQAGGSLLRVLATDPGSVKDFDAFCRQTGNELVESGEAEGTYSFVIRKTQG